MEIIKDNFEASLPMLKKAIEECDFVAMDTEMTGNKDARSVMVQMQTQQNVAPRLKTIG